MRAFVYVEISPNKPISYVIDCLNRYKSQKHHINGCQNLRTIDRSRLIEAMNDMGKRRDITSLVKDRLPPGMEAVGQDVERIPYAKYSQSKRKLPNK